MSSAALRVHYGATTAVDSLTDAEREHLVDVVERLQKTDPATWPADEVRPLAEPGLYLLHLPPDYRIILGRTDTQELEVQTIFREEGLRIWAALERKNGGVHP